VRRGSISSLLAAERERERERGKRDTRGREKHECQSPTRRDTFVHGEGDNRSGAQL